MDVEALKEEAGIAACKYVTDGMHVGLGTGSTVKYTILELGRRVREEGLTIVDGLDVVIDGTDEFDPSFQLIKGGGAALLREKVVAQASKRMVVVADDRKQVATLGAFPLPIEITPFSFNTTKRAIESILGCNVSMRMADGNLLKTDNGNYIADAQTGASITNPIMTEQRLLALAGVVQVGLFNNMCNVVVMASDTGVSILTKDD